jgi:hypothetical protein
LPVSTRREVAKALEASPNLDSLSLPGGEVIVEAGYAKGQIQCSEYLLHA